jgi:hypothetical protein
MLAGSHFVAVELGRFLPKFPEVRVNLLNGTYDALLTKPRGGSIDFLIGLLKNPPPRRRYSGGGNGSSATRSGPAAPAHASSRRQPFGARGFSGCASQKQMAACSNGIDPCAAAGPVSAGSALAEHRRSMVSAAAMQDFSFDGSRTGGCHSAVAVGTETGYGHTSRRS